jgi:hypothetical protein
VLLASARLRDERPSYTSVSYSIQLSACSLASWKMTASRLGMHVPGAKSSGRQVSCPAWVRRVQQRVRIQHIRSQAWAPYRTGESDWDSHRGPASESGVGPTAALLEPG